MIGVTRSPQNTDCGVALEDNLDPQRHRGSKLLTVSIKQLKLKAAFSCLLAETKRHALQATSGNRAAHMASTPRQSRPQSCMHPSCALRGNSLGDYLRPAPQLA